MNYKTAEQILTDQFNLEIAVITEEGIQAALRIQEEIGQLSDAEITNAQLRAAGAARAYLDGLQEWQEYRYEMESLEA
ncbi:hypothetical protein [Anatilimnocola floriformis]|uniref:hypothetical protein n=1 Tax=Anatilimnocola floriformis TaxID=2948575 RepID=UPI0020C1C323|nr:hypothetical protein [Anatilimnocola floriformis]